MLLTKYRLPSSCRVCAVSVKSKDCHAVSVIRWHRKQWTENTDEREKENLPMLCSYALQQLHNRLNHLSVNNLYNEHVLIKGWSNKANYLNASGGGDWGGVGRVPLCVRPDCPACRRGWRSLCAPVGRRGARPWHCWRTAAAAEPCSECWPSAASPSHGHTEPASNQGAGKTPCCPSAPWKKSKAS